MTYVLRDAEAPRIEAASGTWLARPSSFWLVLLLYLAVHLAFRLWETPILGKNDVQEALAAQGWAWGYHPRNPPLHTWLLMASYSVFGVGVLAHAVLKYVLLGATYAFGYLVGRRTLSTQTMATMAAFSFTLLTPFAWTVHTALTHTLLLATVILATLWAAERVTRHGRWLDYAILGVVIGLGFLAKYSYPLFLGPLIVAMLCQRSLRPFIVSWRMLAALAVAAIVFAPHAVWMFGAQFDFVRFLAEKQHGDAPQQPYLADVGLGLVNLAFGALSFVAPLLLMAAIFLRKVERTPWRRLSPWARTLMLVPALSLGLLIIDVVLFRATQFEERYFLCALLVAPLALFSGLDPRATRQADAHFTRFAVGTLVAALIVMAGLSGRALEGGQTCDRCWNEMALPQFAQQIRQASGFERGTILADHYNVGGNLSLAFPNERVIAANYILDVRPRRASGQCLLVWNARNSGDGLPPSIADYLAERHVRIPVRGGPAFFEAPLLRAESRADRFAYWLLPTADGNCEPRAPGEVSVAALR